MTKKENDQTFDSPLTGGLPKNFNKKKIYQKYSATNNPTLQQLQNMSKKQCLGKEVWIPVEKLNIWMITAETATFMKLGGLGMIASELPENFNIQFSANNEKAVVITPMYLGNTGKKKASFDGKTYVGAEQKSIEVNKICTLHVPFYGEKNTLVKHSVDVFSGTFEHTEYVFLKSDRFFSINPSENNNPAQDGCYVCNEFGINEVERFAFLSKAVFVLLKQICSGKCSLQKPTSLIANDWHAGALSGLLKYLSLAQAEVGNMGVELAEELSQIPVIHIVHHLGYQGWDYENTSKLLNSLYEDTASVVYKNAKAVKNSNPRTGNSLIVHDCYNQACCNLMLADKVVTVSKNYMEEVSKDLAFGFDFRDILKIRKDHRNFFGIVNGYEKALISPNAQKIEKINAFFENTNFKVFDENSIDIKNHNKKEFLKLLSKLASDTDYKNKKIPLIETYKFDAIDSSVGDTKDVPVFCATSRLVEQKGYDIACQSILSLLEGSNYKEPPFFILGGAGDDHNFSMLTKLKDKLAEKNPKAAKRIFVFRGYKDEFAYAIQLASDFYLMPSHFEPCGLTQMEAMAKGAIPIATSTGGLVDTIDDGINGFRTEVFFGEKKHVYGNNITAKRLKTNERAYAETLEKALNTFYQDPISLQNMTKAAMQKDFGWSVAQTGSLFKYYNLLKNGHI